MALASGRVAGQLLKKLRSRSVADANRRDAEHLSDLVLVKEKALHDFARILFERECFAARWFAIDRADVMRSRSSAAQ